MSIHQPYDAWHMHPRSFNSGLCATSSLSPITPEKHRQSHHIPHHSALRHRRLIPISPTDHPQRQTWQAHSNSRRKPRFATILLFRNTFAVR